MHAGQRTKMKRGAILACALPMGIGMLAATIIVIGFLQMSPSLQEVHLRHPYIVWIIAGSLIFVPPLSAWLACQSLAKIESVETLSRWRSSAGRALLFATLVQFLSPAFYRFGFLPSSLNWYILSGVPNLVSWLRMNLILWLIITLPLSLLCATIFWKTTKFPADTNVF